MPTDATVEDDAILQHIQTRLEQYDSRRRNLLPMLQMIQQTAGYLPAPTIGRVAACLNISASEVYGVATFYNQFRFNPPGKNPVKVCLGTACHVKAADIILENFERKLGIAEGETTPDREFSLERVACVGCCALAPVAVVGDTVHGHMAPSKVEGLVLRISVEKERLEREKQQNEGNPTDS